MYMHTNIVIVLKFEPQCEKTGLWGFRPGPLQSQKKPRSLKFRIKEDDELHYLHSENKCADQISFAVTAKLICAFVFDRQKSSFLMMRLI